MPNLLPQSWPALLIGLILASYWIKVMHLVRRTKRQAGHHANLIPEEKLGRVIRVVWIPVIVLWIVLPLLAANGVLAQFWPMRPASVEPIVRWVALAVGVFAFAVTWLCWIRMGKSWRMGIDPNERTQLVFTGPFAYVRHPIYGLSQLLMLMTIAIVPSPLMLVVGVLHILFMQWEVRREDRYLCTVHGDAYEVYQRKVGRFFPKSLRAYRPQSVSAASAVRTAASGRAA
jgi:protein-S-isoprenylcysteine O-methyltransferase Ste14